MSLLQVAGLLVCKFVDQVALTPAVCGIMTGAFYAVGIISGNLLIKAGQKRPQVLVRAVMGSTVLKFFIYIIILVIMMFATDADRLQLGVLFFILYSAFTIFEKTFIIKSLKGSDMSSGATPS